MLLVHAYRVYKMRCQGVNGVKIRVIRVLF